MRVCGKASWLAAFGLVVGVVLGCVPAVAQDGRDGGSVDAGQGKRPFAFEVFSIRLHKPGTATIERQYTRGWFSDKLASPVRDPAGL